MPKSNRQFILPIPKTPDPFINTPLISIGPNPDGLEQFWISSWNHNAGSLGLCVTERGEVRRYPFKKASLPGFYSAVSVDPNVLWLCGNLSQVVRLDLRTGRFEAFPTGAPKALAFQGMIYDPPSGQLFMAAFPAPNLCAFAFDTRARKSVKTWCAIADDHYMRCSFPNGDGSYSAVLHCPGESLIRWTPGRDELPVFSFNPRLDTEKLDGGTTYSLISNEQGFRYFPTLGWYDSSQNRFQPQTPAPEREMTWFARRGEWAWGITQNNGTGLIGRWHLPTGRVKILGSLPDMTIANINLTRAGDALIGVNLFGIFFRLNAETGVLEISRQLPVLSHGHLDCLCADAKTHTLVGTPFITQRFWTFNLRTRKGEDAGRAAPGFGEVLRTWSLHKKIYMAAYTGGELVEFDPRQPARFPENPRVVADPPDGMRPVAGCDDGRRIFYACSHPYGHTGSVLTRYDVRSGETLYFDNALPGLQIRSLFHDPTTQCLIAGASVLSDCQSCSPTVNQTALALINPETLAPIKIFHTPTGINILEVRGALGPHRWLITVSGILTPDTPPGTRWFAWDSKSDHLPDFPTLPDLPFPGSIQYAGKPGLFIVQHDFKFDLWDLRKPALIRTLHRDKLAYRGFVVGSDFYAARCRSLIQIKDFLT